MKISTKGRYALRMLVDLAEHQNCGFVALKDIADRQNISKKYLEQGAQSKNQCNEKSRQSHCSVCYKICREKTEKKGDKQPEIPDPRKTKDQQHLFSALARLLFFPASAEHILPLLSFSE